MPFALTSPAFADGAPIPALYGCTGENISPPLAWSGPPPGAKSFVIIIEDPDAPGGTFRHWGVYNIPGNTTALPPDSAAAYSSVVNDFGRTGYDGPCPPPGGTHHYHFRIAALRNPAISISADASVVDLWHMAQPYALGEAELIGTYTR